MSCLRIELPEDKLLVSNMELRGILQEVLLNVTTENLKDDIMTIKETAKFLKVSVPTIRGMIANKDIPFFQRGQVIRLSRKDVAKWMRNGTNYEV